MRVWRHTMGRGVKEHMIKTAELTEARWALGGEGAAVAGTGRCSKKRLCNRQVV